MSLSDRHFNSVEETFEQCFDMMINKAHDYSADDNPYSNFEFAANAAKITVEQGILFLLGIKMARLRELILSGKNPKNEPVDDTCNDSINYTAILKSYRANGGAAEKPAEEDAEELEYAGNYLGQLNTGAQGSQNWFTNLLRRSAPAEEVK